jgi:hypothetical protein
MPGVQKSLKIRPQAFSPFTHTYVCTQKNPRCEGWNVLSFRLGSVGRPPSLDVLSLTSFIHGWYTVNPFLFIRGLSFPSCIQASLSLNCLKLTIPGFPYNCLPVTCGDIGFKKNPMSSIGLEIRPQSAFPAFRALLPSANCSAEWSVLGVTALQIVMAFWHTIVVSRGLSHPTQKVWIQSKRAPNCH